ncbi:guanylate kinase [Limibacillus halophilus]|jgi:guanylate kinase
MSQQPIKRRGLMLVLSSPSGAGKTTISRRILESEPGMALSISATTRQPRPGEVEGKDYFFVTPERFDQMVAEGAFLEHARVFDHRYGTPRAPVEEALAAGRDVLFDIDWQGTQQIREAAREDLVAVFILPPSTGALEARLKSRAQDSDEVVARRMAKAADEMSHWQEYDYVVVNREVEESVAQVASILAAERLRRDRQSGLRAFVESLRGEEG